MTIRPRLFTVGHGSRPGVDLIRLLERSHVRLVLDIRTNPVSVRSPWFERYALRAALEEVDIGYRWMRELGGLRRARTPETCEHTGLDDDTSRAFAVAMNQADIRASLEEIAGLARTTTVTLLCAEVDPASCHRNLIADALTLAGLEVLHLIDFQTERPHVLNENIEVIDGRIVYRKKQLTLL